MRALVIALTLMMTGCFQTALEQFCDGIGSDCSCSDGACCVNQGATCGDLPCCGGLICSPDAVCEAGYRLSLTVEGGPGAVQVEPGGLSCTGTCVWFIPPGTAVTISNSVPGVQLESVQGAPCDGAAPCAFTMNAATTLSARLRPWLHVIVENGESRRREVFVQASAAEAISSSKDYVATGTVSISASVAGDSFRWEDACASADDGQVCTLDVTGPVDARIRFVPYNHVFQRPVAAPGALGGLAKADALCNSLDPSAGGALRAFLSAPGVPAASRIATGRGFANGSGYGAALADTMADLIAGRIAFNYSKYDWPFMVGGTAADGSDNCQGWTSTAGTFTAGNLGMGGTSFVRDPGLAPQRCDAESQLLCFDTRFDARVRPTPGGALTFLTAGLWTPGGGVASADALCMAEATAAGRSGTFMAGVVMQNASNPTSVTGRVGYGAWSRPDGFWFPTFDSNALNVTLAGAPLSSDGTAAAGARVWTGAANYGSPIHNCSDWTSTSGTASAGRPEATIGYLQAPPAALEVPCDVPQHLYCFEKAP